MFLTTYATREPRSRPERSPALWIVRSEEEEEQVKWPKVLMLSTISELNMRNTTTSTSSWVPKPLRLRTACDACHASKVRCTGESPCTRCREYGKKCEFQVSMVGRSSKNKRQQKQSATKSASSALQQRSSASTNHLPSPPPLPVSGIEERGIRTPPSTTHTSSSTSPNTSTVQPVVSLASFASQDFSGFTSTAWTPPHVLNTEQELMNEDSMMNEIIPDTTLSVASPDDFTADFLHQDDVSLEYDLSFDLSSVPDSNSSVHQTNLTPVHDEINVDYTNSKLRTYPYQQVTHHMRKTPEPARPLDQLGQHQEFPHVTALSRVIESLERYIQRETTGIDEVMRVNKLCLAEIADVMRSPIFKVCKSCKLLILTAMDLIITFYETGISEDMQVGQNKSQPHGARARDCRSPSKVSLNFGVFQFEDNASIRQQIIRHELERCIQLMQSQWTELCGSGDNEPTSAQKLHRQWFGLIESRARTLSASLQFVDAPV